MGQRLFHHGLPTKELPATGHNLQRMASRIIESFTDRRVVLYECEDLKRDLLKLRVEEKSYGYRLVSPRDHYGHGDLASAFANALIAADDVANEELVVIGTLDSADWNFEPYPVTSTTTTQIREAWSHIIRNGLSAHPNDFRSHDL